MENPLIRREKLEKEKCCIIIADCGLRTADKGGAMIPSATDGRCVAGNFVKATVAFLLLLTLVACGGGGGGSSLPIQPINVADNGNNGGPTDGSESGPTAFPARANGLTLPELNAAITPVLLEEDDIRTIPPDIDLVAVGPPTAETPDGLGYFDNDGNLFMLVRFLEFAHMGIWVNGDVKAVDNFHYTWLGENIISNSTVLARVTGEATYDMEGDAVYNGVRFYPDGELRINFTERTFIGEFSASGSEVVDDFGDANAMVPDGSGGMRAVTSEDNFNIQINNGRISRIFLFAPYQTSVEGTGFFAALDGLRTRDGTGFDFGIGVKFHDDETTYDPLNGPPVELSGEAGFSNHNGARFRMGFLGRLQQP